MTIFIVMDHYCEGDSVIAVFSTNAFAQEFIREHENDPYSDEIPDRRYDSLEIEEFTVDELVTLK